jgi:periplasmic protein CpxP/Spy
MKRALRPITMFACITALTAFGSQFAAAQTPPKNPAAAEQKCGEQFRHHRGHFLKKLAKQLGLSGEQKAQAKALLQKDRAENKPLFQAVMAEKHQLRNLTLSGAADEAAIRAQSAKVAAAEADLAVKRAGEAKELLALLTPEQVGKLKTIMDKREQGFMQHMSGQHGPEL